MNLLDFERMDRIGVIADALYDKKEKSKQEFQEMYSVISYGADTHIITLTKKEGNIIRSYDIIKLEQGMGRFSYHRLNFHKYTRGY